MINPFSGTILKITHAYTVMWNSFAGCQLLGLSSEKGLLNSIGTASPNWNIKWCPCAHLYLCLLTMHHHSHMLTSCHHKMQPCWAPMTWQCLLVHPCDLLFGITPEYSMAQAEKCSAKKKIAFNTRGCFQLMSLSKVFHMVFPICVLFDTIWFLQAQTCWPHFCIC